MTTKISTLPSLATVTDATIIPVVESGATKRITGLALKTYTGTASGPQGPSGPSGAAGSNGASGPSGPSGPGTLNSGTAGYVPYYSTSTTLSAPSSGNLYWDNTNARLGVGTTSPGSTVDIKGTLRLSGSSSGYVGLSPASAAGSTTYTLPSADGSSGSPLTTNGSGTLSWGGLTDAGFSSSAFDLQGKSFSMYRGQTTVGGSSTAASYPSGYGWPWAGSTTVCGLVAYNATTTVKNIYNQPNGLMIIEMTAADGGYGNITNGGHEIWSVQVAHHGWNGGAATLLNSKGTLHGSYTTSGWYQIIITGGSGSGTYYRITWIN